MKKWLAPLLVTSGLLLAACGNTEEEKQTTENTTEQVKVYTTVYPLTYFTEVIGGEYVDVESVYPPGANEHSFEPTQKDMIDFANADVLFYIGLGLEGFVENAKETLANEDLQFIATTDNVSDEKLAISTGEVDSHEGETAEEHAEHSEEPNTDSHEDETVEEESGHKGHGHGELDPHVWLSTDISKDLALAIKENLVEEMPEQAAVFEDNYTQLVTELESLDTAFEEMTTSVSNNTFFVSHAAFGYIAGAYNLEQVAISGLNSQDEPSQAELVELVKMAKERNIQYVLFEQNVSSKLTEVIQEELGAKSLTLHNLSVLTDEDFQNNENYFTLMEKNIETLRQALTK
ncbi:zinc ABC transporter substrate-binding protein [Solibacillus sp. FSL R7-0668]|uniref:metal ABC transporter solute-binding protein, Zn/Mn family n=1 Tax=Solibacillus sp. FSL R7-0668 TaxID=2921688 RepID=UPI0030FB24C1